MAVIFKELPDADAKEIFFKRYEHATRFIHKILFKSIAISPILLSIG